MNAATMSSMANIDNYYFECDSDFFEDFKLCNVEQNVTVMYTNAQSCANMRTFDEIKYFIVECQCNVDVIVLTETWFKKSETILYDIDGYSAFHSCRNGKRGGGVSVYVRQPCKILKCDVIESGLNFVCVDIMNYKHLNLLRVVGAYRPPNGDNFNEFMMTLERITSENGVENTVIIGDININVSAAGEVVEGIAIYKNYMVQMKSYGFALCNTNTTRERSGTIIDHFFSTCSERYTHRIDTIKNTFSDHNIIVAKIRIVPVSRPTLEERTKINYDKLNELVANKLRTDMPICDDVDVQYDFLVNTITTATAEATTTYSVNRRKSKMCEWVESSPNVLVLINQKKNLWKKYKNNDRLNKDNSEVRRKIHEINNKLVTVKRLAKEKYYGRRFANASGSKETWKIINEIISLKKNRTQVIISLENTETGAVAESFAEHFATVGQRLADKIEKRSEDHYNKLNTMKRVAPSIMWHAVSQLEVSSLIQALNVKKAAGIDGISATVLKHCNECITPALTKIFNESLQTGIYPQGMKTARVTPIYKSGTKNVVDNYRPISVLPILNNIFEKVIYTRLLAFLERFDVLHRYQYGFRRKISTSTALNEIVNMIQCNLNDRQKSAGLFMDLSKAFDTVDHQILLDKLETYGIRGTPWKLFKSYLTNRGLVVKANDIISRQYPIGISVPQGSVLGPILYLLYVNDMGALKLNGKLRLFADDSSTFYCDRSSDTITRHVREDVELLTEYFRLNRLTLNLNKTKYIKFGRSRNEENYNIPTKTAVIEQTDCVKYLGLHIDKLLNWRKHIDFVATKIAGGIGALGKLNFLPVKILQSIYFAIVHPHLQYAAAIWTAARKTHLNVVLVLQRRALKRCYKLGNLHGTEDLFCNRAVSVLPVRALGVLQMCTAVFNTIHQRSTTNLQFPFVETDRPRRTDDPFVHRRVWNFYGESSIQHRGPIEFQKLHVKVRNCTNENTFKLNAKKYLLSKEVKVNYLR